MFEVEVHIGGKVYGHGDGRNKQSAARQAALAALEMIEKSEYK